MDVLAVDYKVSFTCPGSIHVLRKQRWVGDLIFAILPIMVHN